MKFEPMKKSIYVSVWQVINGEIKWTVWKSTWFYFSPNPILNSIRDAMLASIENEV